MKAAFGSPDSAASVEILHSVSVNVMASLEDFKLIFGVRVENFYLVKAGYGSSNDLGLAKLMDYLISLGLRFS